MSRDGRITRKIEFDAGHRIPLHDSKCRSVHGHRYVLEATICGPIIEQVGSDEGMVCDFGRLKDVMIEAVGGWDHSFLVYSGDDEVVSFLRRLPGQQFVIMSNIPTVENLARCAFGRIEAIVSHRGLRLVHVRLYETPNCWADVTEQEYHGENQVDVPRV